MRPALVPDLTPLSAHEASRVLLTVSCGDCDDLPKVAEAGEVVDRDGTAVQVMHNGVVVEAGGYFGPWMAEIIRCLRGHHEPQEELVFASVVERLVANGPAAPSVVELGAFWAYYALWALHELPQARVVALEPDPANLELGRRNFALNGRSGTFVHGVMGRDPGVVQQFELNGGSTTRVQQYDLATLLAETGHSRVDLLLCDIQGGEAFIFGQAADLLRAGAVRFVIISTHHHSISGDPLTHQTLLAKLRGLGAHVIAEHTVGESCSGDGLIAVSFDPADADLTVEISRVRQQDSLFGPLEADLADALDRVRRAERALDALAAEARADAAAAAVVVASSAAAQAASKRCAASVSAELDRLRASRLWRWSETPRRAYAGMRQRAGRT